MKKYENHSMSSNGFGANFMESKLIGSTTIKTFGSVLTDFGFVHVESWKNHGGNYRHECTVMLYLSESRNHRLFRRVWPKTGFTEKGLVTLAKRFVFDVESGMFYED